MDCDYTPEKAALAKKIKSEARMKKKMRKKRCNEEMPKGLDEAIKKPIFDEALHRTFQNYLDEYYKLECEGFIGDMPCRFKYRNVVPNSFGLTVEEILAADDKELNKWCSINKLYQIRPKHVEINEVTTYDKKGKDEKLKRKILQSLYKCDDDDDDDDDNNNNNNVGNNDDKQSEGPESHKKRKKNIIEKPLINMSTVRVTNSTEKKQFEKRKKKRSNYASKKSFVGKKKSKYIKHVHRISFDEDRSKLNRGRQELETQQVVKEDISNKRLGKRSSNNLENNVTEKKAKLCKSNSSINNTKIPGNENNSETLYDNISDTRLKAYGIKPKKFKNKLKYGNNK